ncbi:MAG: hypothetical protein MAG431_00135 [Chloroflexi bacterium]|nr:hypothetical protein [Chloroflexota bacterium]
MSVPVYSDVTPRFREAYGILQWEGEYILGESVSSLCKTPDTEVERQYFENGVLVYNPYVSPHYYLDTLDNNLIPGHVVPLKNVPTSARLVGDWILLNEFVSLYEEHGERWLGEPTTSTLWNPQLERYEQYFENMAAFRYEGDPPDRVRFLPAGEMKYSLTGCGEVGLENPLVSPPVDPSYSGELDSNLAKVAESRLGSSFVGLQLTGDFWADDGKKELIYENVAIYADESSPMGISLRPLPVILGYPTDSLETPQEGMYFRAISGEQGYNIPGYFNSFISLHSGHELAGEPISRLQDLGNSITQQCFENYCLRYDPKLSPREQVSLLPLGIEYKGSVDTSGSSPSSTSPSSSTSSAPSPTPLPTQTPALEMFIWVLYSQITSVQSQMFGVCVQAGDDALYEYSARLLFPSDGNNFSFPSPDDKGCAYVKLPPIEKSNGTLIEYQVCITSSWGERLCANDNFLIWGNP